MEKLDERNATSRKALEEDGNRERRKAASGELGDRRKETSTIGKKVSENTRARDDLPPAGFHRNDRHPRQSRCYGVAAVERTTDVAH